MRRDQPAVVLVAVSIVILGAVRGAAQVDPPRRPSAPMASAGAPERTGLQAKVQGLDLFGPVSATWSAENGVRMQAARIANSSATASPAMLLRLWATNGRPIFGQTVHPWIFGSHSLGVLAPGTDLHNVDTGYVPFQEPPPGCYYVTMSLDSPNGADFTYWSFVTFTFGGTPDGHGYSRFAFGGASCSGSSAATPGVLYAVENDDASTLFRIDDYTSSPRATDIGSTGLASPAIAIDPTTQLLYAFDNKTRDLYRIDAGTGGPTSIGDSGLSSPSLVALAARADGTLFAWDAFNTNLYRLDKGTGRATLVGYTGYHAGGDLVFATDGTLYGSTGSALVRIDPVTAAANAVGSFGVSSVFGLAVGADGTLLAGRDTSLILDSSRLYRVDRNTGTATPIGGSLSRSIGDLALLSAAAILPDADFTWSPIQPTTGQQVQFTDHSTGAPTSWHWNFDGQPGDDSTAQNPAWTFTSAGGHEVTLRACNAAGCTTAVQTVTVSQQASLSIDGPFSGVGLTLDPLTFEAKATGCIANPFGWTWTTDADLEFDRGAIGALFNGTIVRGWTTTGTHTVSVRNNTCPGAVGTLSVQLVRPGGQETWVTRRLRVNPQQHPTVVFCHGWQKKGFDATCKKPSNTVSCGGTLWSCIDKCDPDEVSFSAGTLLAGDTELNQIQFIWDGAGQIPALTLPRAVDYLPAWNQVDDAARQLAKSLLITLGEDYQQPIQFVGHSLGSVVCAQAAVRFLREAHDVPALQVTVLDRPDHVHKLVGSAQFQKFEDLFGFDESYFPALLQRAVRPGLDLFFDNYWASTGAGVGDSSACAEGVIIRNRDALIDPGHVGNAYFGKEGGNDHSGVHQWYRWSVDAGRKKPSITQSSVCTPNFQPPSGIGSSLSPCDDGWNIALANADPAHDAFAANCDLPLDIDLEPMFGCVSSAGSTPCQVPLGELVLEEDDVAIADDATVVPKATSTTVEVPASARNVVFDLVTSKAVASLWALVLLDRTPIWSGPLGSFTPGRATEIGPVPVDGLAGRRQLSLQLSGSGSATVQVGNFRVQTIRPPCDTGDALCVTGHRFRVEADWTTPDGHSGHAVPRYVGTDASGFMWFFDAANLELIVKVLDGCGVNNRYWVFAAGLTNVSVRLTVIDTATGARKVYDNPQGSPFAPIQDSDALATCGHATAATASDAALANGTAPTAIAGPEISKLRQGRFDVTATWRTAAGATGAGRLVSVTDDSGYLWFFNPANIEVAIKVLDGCGLNQRFWVFAAGLTDVEVDLTVRDRRTGATRSYHNPAGQPFLPIQDTGAFATCP